MFGKIAKRPGALRGKIYAKARGARGRGAGGKVGTSLVVQRTSHGGQAAFEACVMVGQSLQRKHQVCAFGRNPRQAIGSALEKVGRQIKSKKRGAFAGKR